MTYIRKWLLVRSWLWIGEFWVFDLVVCLNSKLWENQRHGPPAGFAFLHPLRQIQILWWYLQGIWIVLHWLFLHHSEILLFVLLGYRLAFWPLLSAFWPLRLLTAPAPTPPHHLALCIETPAIVGNLRSQTSQAWGSSNAITSDSVVDDTDSLGITVMWTVFGMLILMVAVRAATSLKFCSCVWLFSMLVLKLATSSAYDNSSRSQFGTLGICQPWPGVVRFQMELRQRMKRIGLKMSPCSTPLLIGKASESVPLMPLILPRALL